MRTRPIRNWSNLYRRSDSWGSPQGSSEEAEGPPHDGSWTDAVAYGVDLGYRVLEEQLRQGQRFAEQVRSRTYDAGAMGDDVREVGERLVRYYADLTALWIELLTSLAGGDVFGLWRSRQRPRQDTRPREEAAPSGSAVSIELTSNRPACMKLELAPRADERQLASQDLRAFGAGKPPLTDVEFETAAPPGVVQLRLRVPDHQPPGLYVGAVVDRRSGQPCGTLSVELAG